jgi:hypothetical protein
VVLVPSVTDVQAIAPDAAAAAAAHKLAKSRLWREFGLSERAVWGEYHGSARYQTAVSVPELAFKCTCPSRRVPCKHALGLLFALAESKESFEEMALAEEPQWVLSWLSKREATRQRQQRRSQGAPAKPVDLEARARRAGKRHANVLAGIEQLEIWMADLVRQGLGRLPNEDPELWDTQARRLVDAQAPGLASRIRSIGSRVGIGDAWMQRVLGDLGRLALLTHAYRRLDALSPPLRDDVRRWVGFTLDKDEVLARGEAVDDDWVVASASIDDDERLRMRRAWLVGKQSARVALILDVAAGSTPFQHTLVTASAFRARLVFWPSSRPERALLAERLSTPTRDFAAPHARSIAAALDEYASGLARDPWLERTLFVLENVVIARAAAPVWYAVDASGASLRLRGDRHDVLFALSGGRPLCLAAEWNGFVLEPLTAYSEGRAVALKATSA